MRSPKWWLDRYVGRLLSTWGPRSYDYGGQASIGARIRDRMTFNDVICNVRGHRSAGHTIYNPILARFIATAGSPCTSLFQLALNDELNIRDNRRRWARKPEDGGEISGGLAMRWLLGDDSVLEEIHNLW